MNRSGSRYSILTSCLATLLACVLLSTGAAVPPSVAAPVHSMEDAAVLPQQAAAPSQAASLAGQTAKHTPRCTWRQQIQSRRLRPASPPGESSGSGYHICNSNSIRPESRCTGSLQPARTNRRGTRAAHLYARPAEFVRSVLTAVLTQILTGRADRDAVITAIERLPMPQEQAVSLAAALLDGQKGSSTIDIIKGLIGAVGDGIHQVDITLGSTPYPGVYEFLGDYIKDDGTSVHVSSGVYYDEATGLVYGKDGAGMFAIGFDYDAGQYLCNRRNRSLAEAVWFLPLV